MHAFSSFSSTASSSCSTPNTMLYTRHGHVPNLTSDLFDKHIAPYVNHGRNLLFQVLLPSIFDSLDVIDASGGLREFCRMPGNSLLHFTLLDPLAQRDTVTNKLIYVWNKRNRKKIDMNLFKVALKAMRVDSFSTPFDFDTPIDCSDKRMQKSLKRSSNFLQQINGEDILMRNAVLSIGGGPSSEYRMKYAKELFEQNPGVSAISLDLFSWCEVGEGKEDFDESFLSVLISKTLMNFPADKLRITEGPWNPEQVLFLISQGIEMFDSSFPIMLAEKGMAFGLAEGFPLAKGEEQYSLVDMDNQTVIEIEHVPLYQGCSCYTCNSENGYTRAYLNHLWRCKEMLAKTLLTIHNMREWLRMFELIKSQKMFVTN